MRKAVLTGHRQDLKRKPSIRSSTWGRRLRPPLLRDSTIRVLENRRMTLFQFSSGKLNFVEFIPLFSEPTFQSRWVGYDLEDKVLAYSFCFYLHSIGYLLHLLIG